MKNSKELEKTSKFLCLVLRHDPEKIGLALDGSRWAIIDQLPQRLTAHGHAMTLEQLREVDSVLGSLVGAGLARLVARSKPASITSLRANGAAASCGYARARTGRCTKGKIAT
ncbi:MAG TPA: hypothetical protein DCW29_08595 [Janthinobacterium sp.]|nr:hypothetical protein [Janthinobacterium sp.]